MVRNTSHKHRQQSDGKNVENRKHLNYFTSLFWTQRYPKFNSETSNLQFLVCYYL